MSELLTVVITAICTGTIVEILRYFRDKKANKAKAVAEADKAKEEAKQNRNQNERDYASLKNELLDELQSKFNTLALQKIESTKKNIELEEKNSIYKSENTLLKIKLDKFEKELDNIKKELSERFHCGDINCKKRLNK